MMQAETVAKSDLHIEMVKYMRVYFSGTRAQLVEEGLIPEGTEWPERQRSDVEWSHGGYDYRPARRRPPGFKGKQSDWAKCDCWIVSCEPKGILLRYSDLRIEEQFKAAKRNRESNTPLGMRMIDDYIKAVRRARNDQNFMAIFERLQGR